MTGRLRGLRPFVWFVLLPAALAGVAWLLGAGNVSRPASPPFVHALYTLLLSLTVVAIAAGTGRRALGFLHTDSSCGQIEKLSFSFALGTGILGLGTYALGLVGLLRPPAILALLALAALIAAPSFARLQQDLAEAAAELRGDWRASRLGAWLVFGVVSLLALLTLLLALAPPWGYDGLMYHLVAPRLWLQAGRILPLPTILQANGPVIVQLLYGIGLALGTDTFSQVIHLAFGSALVFAVLGAGRRLLGPGGGWIAAGILLGIPIVPLWGTLPYVDMAQAFYEFLAVWCILRWTESESGRREWLTLAAIMAALALGTKLTALFMIPALFAWILVLGRKRGWGHTLRIGAVFAIVACALASPWYVFNLVSLGDPFYPFLRGDAVWPAQRVLLHLDYLRSFGAGTSLLDFVLLPWNLYARHEVFAEMMASIEFPSLLFPLALLLPFVTSTPRARPLSALALLRVGTWFVGSQQLRFLLPVYPVLSLMTAAVLLGIESRLHLRLKFPRVSAALTAGMVVTTLLYAAIFTVTARPFAALTGSESRDAYLARQVYDYRAMRFIHESLPETARVLELWDGQSYYCGGRCLPDAGQVQAAYLLQQNPTVEAMSAALGSDGVTHVLLDLEGLNFLLSHDPRGTHEAAARFYVREFLPVCGEPIYEDDHVQLYRLTCSIHPSAGKT